MDILKVLDIAGIVVALIGAVTGSTFFLIKKIKKFRRRKSSRLINKYEEWIRNDDFNEWKTDLVFEIYDGMPFVEAYGKKYPSICFKAPLDMAEVKEKIDDLSENNNSNKNNERYFESSIVCEYKKIIKNYISRPHSTAYALNKLQFNENDEIIGYSAKLCKFEKAILSTNIMEFEMAKEFFSNKNINHSEKTYNIENMLKRLPIRKAIHSDHSFDEVLKEGKNRDAIMSVQMLILFKSGTDDDYKTFVIRRSKKVLYGQNTWQFIPCGYFEMFGNENNLLTIENHFNSLNTALKEMLEEIFGLEEFIDNKEGCPIENISNHEMCLYINELIENKLAFIRFLGVVLDAVTLTHKLSYLLVIDEVEFSRKIFRPNFEAHSMEIPALGELWKLVKGSRLLPESAGLIKMAVEHPLVKERVGEIDIS